MRQYDSSSVESILDFSMRLWGKSLADLYPEITEVENPKSRGDLGSLVEKYLFEIDPGNSPEPDFQEVGLELKTTGVVPSFPRSRYKAKERLVLSMIDYHQIVTENWEESSVRKKCQKMLILFYEYKKDTPVYDYKFVLRPYLYEIPDEDLLIIKSDWEFIRNRVVSERAHELSEGDTFYLGACRKGSGGSSEPLRSQPFSEIGAKARAFSFKQGYLNQLVQRASLEDLEVKHVSAPSFEDLVERGFKRYLGMSVEQLEDSFNMKKAGPNQKSFHRSLVLRILARNSQSNLMLRKAGIEIKTIRISANGSPRESMPFPSFDFSELASQEWEDSTFAQRLEQKFLFVIFKTLADGSEILDRVAYWNMPYQDREEAKIVWQEAKSRVIRNVEGMPRISENRVAHVRPHGRNSQDRVQVPSGEMWMRQSFWLNSKYIQGVISNL